MQPTAQAVGAKQDSETSPVGAKEIVAPPSGQVRAALQRTRASANPMLKFMVVLYRRPDLTPAQFCHHLENIHAPLAMALPGLKKYTQNHAIQDPKRNHPGWDAIIELYFDHREVMEAAWAGPQGIASDADLPLFADLTRTTWSVVEELNLLP